MGDYVLALLLKFRQICLSENLPEFPPITDPSPALPLLVGVRGGFRLPIPHSPFPIPHSPFPIPYYLLPITYYLLPISKVKNLPLSATPCSLLPTPYSLLPTPCSLFPAPMPWRRSQTTLEFWMLGLR
ncbi:MULTISPECIES: hypothetical protein [Moorena]|uniref:hypothetical protein n=1 Tax=Moorena TaxID=1155738 RepID=UPI0002F8BD1B|nr:MULTISPECIES: hypothetical protein [Moorena]NEP63947.1 hypothetical protein [Moorena sp. SIO3A5]NER87049.1 hypothetical protein [Moorena sp. SIO3A2]NES40916.1 hypothetical protein [Moorena sp. SIO2C4]